MTDGQKKNLTIKNRSEIIFIYETNNNNPNGDPLQENHPRMDETTQRCMVSDVRLKRNIRDHLLRKGENILISNWEKEDGTIKMARERALELEDSLKASGYNQVKQAILKNCIDARLFGCAIPLGEGNRSIQLTGPVQFLYGISEFPVQVNEIQGTAAFAASKAAQQRSFRNEFIIPFAVIKFYGVINELLAKDTELTTEDIKKFDNAIWEGTLGLQSRSKIGHKPHLYARVVYKENKSHIGLIHQKLQIEYDSAKDGTDLRSIDEVIFNLDSLEKTFSDYKERIEKVIVKESEDIIFKGYESFNKFLEKLKIPSEKTEELKTPIKKSL